MESTVVCVVANREDAVALISQLLSGGIAKTEISAVFPHGEDGHEFAEKYGIDIPDAAIRGGVVGGGAGAFIGGTIGLLAGVGALAIPGIGPLVGAGPLLALLAGATTGATFGSIAGGLVSMGISEPHAKHLENKLREGQILLSVHTASKESFQNAERIFKVSGAVDVFTGTAPPG
ncbi:MAG: hypothetical protein ABI183_14690 [Polyangiaceae bacterium]